MPKGVLLSEPGRACCGRRWRSRAEQKADAQRHSNSWQNIGRLKPGATHPAGAAAGRRAQRRQPRTLSPIQGAAHQRGVPHHRRSAAGHAGARHQADAVSDVGRRAVRAAHRLRQRREPRARAIARAHEGAGDAAGARRGPLARRTPARHRERPAHARVGRRSACSSAMRRCRLLGTLNIQELPRGEEIRLDGVVVAYTLGVAALIGLVLGLIPVANVLPANLTLVLREEGRERHARASARARFAARSSSRRSGSRSSCSSAPACCSRASARCWRSIRASTPDGVLTASISLPRARYADDDKLRALHGRGAAPAARAAGRRRGRRDRHDSVRRQQQRQRHPRRGLSDAARRVADLAESQWR